MRLLPILLVSLGMIVVSAIDINVIRSFSIFTTVINVSLLVVLIIALSQGFVLGGTAAGIAAGAAWITSAVSGGVYVVAYLGALTVAWIMVRRIVTTRSLPSLLATFAAATGAYYAFLLTGNAIVHALDRQQLLIPLADVAVIAVWQVIIHPVIALLLWRLLGRDRYGRLQTHSTTM
ncbi:MAG: hypothetical protein HY975_03250 [Candidatus Kerfeldbacteria bacterium]|nr:hypothetical protein [Candidatus Kerfeldbacteria bacterium]